jgi:hypothetical protein
MLFALYMAVEGIASEKMDEDPQEATEYISGSR